MVTANTGDNEKQPTELDKLREFGGSVGVDVDKLLGEIATSVEKSITPKVANSVNQVLARLDENLGQMLGEKVKPMVEGAVTAQLPTLVNEIGTQLIEKYQAGGGGGGQNGNVAVARPGGGFNLMELLKNPSAMEGIGRAIQMFKGGPPDENRLAHDFGLLFNGMQMGLKLKIAPEQIDELAKSFTAIGKGEGQK